MASAIFRKSWLHLPSMTKLSEEKIKLIFGLKIKQLRIDANLSLQDLADKTGLSLSYINEIEKGKKYPKAEKIAALAEAFEVPYDFLVSLKLTKKLAPLGQILESGILDELPLDFFGIDTQKLVELIAASPAKVSAFISTYIDIARNYDMNKEHFFSAALRAYQELNENYFPEIEQAAQSFFKIHGLEDGSPLEYEVLLDLLQQQYKASIQEIDFSQDEELKSFRSLYHPKEQLLQIHKHLSKNQKRFILAKELGYRYLQLPLQERTYFYKGWVNTQTFDQTLINFKASYFAGALLLPEKPLLLQIKAFFDEPQFNEVLLQSMLAHWRATPETLMYRFTNLLPKHFGLNKIFFVRFNQEGNRASYHLSKELHLNRKHAPHANEKGEHYCRRWMSLKIFQEIGPNDTRTHIGIQKSEYLDSKEDYLVLTFARQTLHNPVSNSSINIGIEWTHAKKRIKWLNDNNIRAHKVNVTCERCALSNCAERVAPPILFEQAIAIQKLKERLNNL
jgi:XRE family transcriptional regulator, fatty acid utilization regulator